jgi:hypothetical protein
MKTAKRTAAPSRNGGRLSPVKLTISAPALEAIGRELISALTSCAVTQGAIDTMTTTLTRSSDRLAAALKTATKET